MGEKKNEFWKKKILIYFTLYQNSHFLVIIISEPQSSFVATHGLNTKYLPENGFFFPEYISTHTKEIKTGEGFFRPLSSFNFSCSDPA